MSVHGLLREGTAVGVSFPLGYRRDPSVPQDAGMCPSCQGHSRLWATSFPPWGSPAPVCLKQQSTRHSSAGCWLMPMVVSGTPGTALLECLSVSLSSRPSHIAVHLGGKPGPASLQVQWSRLSAAPSWLQDMPVRRWVPPSSPWCLLWGVGTPFRRGHRQLPSKSIVYTGAGPATQHPAKVGCGMLKA